jgi:hypothetical protein
MQLGAPTDWGFPENTGLGSDRWVIAWERKTSLPSSPCCSRADFETSPISRVECHRATTSLVRGLRATAPLAKSSPAIRPAAVRPSGRGRDRCRRQRRDKPGREAGVLQGGRGDGLVARPSGTGPPSPRSPRARCSRPGAADGFAGRLCFLRLRLRSGPGESSGPAVAGPAMSGTRTAGPGQPPVSARNRSVGRTVRAQREHRGLGWRIGRRIPCSASRGPARRSVGRSSTL